MRNPTTSRIAILGSHFPPTGGGGVTSAHVNLYYALLAAGYDVQFFTFLDSHPVNEAPDPRIHRFGAPLWIRYAIKVACKGLFGILDLFRGSFFARSYHTADILESYWGASKVGKALDEFKPNWIVLPDHCCPGLYIGKPSGAKMVTVSHHNPSRFIDVPELPKQSWFDVKFAVALENQALKKVDAVVCPSAYMLWKFRNTYTYEGPVYEIPNLLDESRMFAVSASSLKQDMGLGEADPLIYVPGAGSPFKGSCFVPELVEKFVKQIPGKKVGFYFSGATTEEFKKQFSQLPSHAKIFFSGQIPNSEHLRHVKACQFGVTPTVLESFGMAVLEAQCLGVPMISFNTDAIPEVILPGRNGEIIPRGNVDALVKTMVQYTVKTPSDGTALGMNLLRSQLQKGVSGWKACLEK